jgi:hypothetical protein
MNCITHEPNAMMAECRTFAFQVLSPARSHREANSSLGDKEIIVGYSVYHLGTVGLLNIC